jgi:hypothetical protein
LSDRQPSRSSAVENHRQAIGRLAADRAEVTANRFSDACLPLMLSGSDRSEASNSRSASQGRDATTQVTNACFSSHLSSMRSPGFVKV